MTPVMQAHEAGWSSYADPVAPLVNLAARFEHEGDRVALVAQDQSVTYGELAERAARWRQGLAAAGVEPGDRVAIVARNTVDFVLAHVATLGLGAMSVPLNPQSPAVELQRELEAVAPAVVVFERREQPAYIETSSIVANLSDLAVFGSELEIGVVNAEPRPIVAVDADDPAVLVFTSGTAGLPKPAILTHANLTSSLQAVLSLPVDLVGQTHCFLGVLPMFHIFGLNTVLNLALLVGASVVLDDYQGPEHSASLITDHAVTVVAGPPTLWRAFTKTSSLDQDQFLSVKLAVSGAAKLAPQLKVDVKDRLGLELAEGYGLTESSAVVASSIATEAPLGSVGRLLPGVEARIVDQEERDCLVGDPGELWVRGPMIFAGYWGHDHTSLTGDGWLRTGDVAVVDEQGFLAIVDRRKDLVIVSGFNVFPAEVETVLTEHPDVAGAGIVGEPSEETGEAVVAFVVPEPDASIEVEELRRYCRNQLAAYKVPSRFVIAADLPLGPTGKLQRGTLRSNPA